MDFDFDISLNVNHYNCLPRDIPKTDSINCLYLNAQSLRNSLNELQYFLDCSKSVFHIVLITETWLKSHETKFFNLTNYQSFHSTRENSNGGGVAIFVHNSFDSPNVLQNLDFCNNNLLIVHLQNININFAVCYRQPNNPQDANACLFQQKLEHILNNYKRCYFFGDFNFNLFTLTSQTIEYKRIIETNGYNILNSLSLQYPTRISSFHNTSTCIDHIFTDMHYHTNTLNHEFYLFDFIGDHKSIRLSINNGEQQRINQEIRAIKLVNHKKIISSKAIEAIDTNSFTTFLQKLTQIISLNTTTKYINTDHTKPHITNKILKLIHIRNRYYRLMKKYPYLVQMKQQHIIYSRMVKSNIEKEKKAVSKKNFTKNLNNSRKTWQHVNNLLYNKKKSPVTNGCSRLIRNGIHITAPRAIANHFNHYFVNVSNTIINTQRINQADLETFHDNEQYTITHDFICTQCTEDEITLIIDNLKSTYTVDFFGISNHFVKLHNKSLIPILTKLINIYMFQGIFPQVLKIGVVTPIFKEGSKDDACNYRPITVLPIFSKIFEYAIYRRLSDHMKINNIIDNFQFGYTAKSNTETAALHILDKIYRSLDNRCATSLTCIDLSKAFDCIQHSILFRKLNKLHFSQFFKNLLVSFYTDRQQVVKIADAISDFDNITTGTAQGGVLSGILFNLYVNSIFRLQLYGSLILYCDDMSLIHSTPNPNLLKEQLEDDLEQISRWLQFHFLTPNARKTKYVLFHNKARFEQFTETALNITFNNNVIERVETIKILGLILDESLSFQPHIHHIQKKIVPFMFAIKRIRHLIPDDIAMNLYYAFIHSHFMYMISIWSATNVYPMDCMEVLQRKALRIILRKDPFCSRKHLYSQKIFPISIYAQFTSHMLVHKIKSGSIKNNVVFQTFDQLHEYGTRNRINFVIQNTNLAIGSNNFFVRGFASFNNLPQHIRAINSTGIFKNRVWEYLFDNSVKPNYLN
jgi:hypothetical protein